MHPLFSIITVTYNASATVAPTMRSVAAQSCRLYEHIIVDGLSSDDTLDQVRRLGDSERTVIHSGRDSGIYDAMNKGMGLAKGDYLIFLNAGDSFADADTLQILADAILANDYPGVVYGQTQLVDASRRVVGMRHLTAPSTLDFRSFSHGMVVCHQAFTVLRRIAPLYDTRWRFSADYEWCIRCLMHSRGNVCVGCTTIDYLDEGMTTRNLRASLWERARIMARYYGFWHAVVRHVSFVPRFLFRKLKHSKQ